MNGRMLGPNRLEAEMSSGWSVLGPIRIKVEIVMHIFPMSQPWYICNYIPVFNAVTRI